MKKIICLILTALIMLSFGSCAASEKKKAEKAIDVILEKEENIPEKQEDVGYRISELIYSKMSYKIVEVNGDECTVEVKSPDVKAIFDSCFNPEEYSGLKAEDYEAAENELSKAIEKKLLDKEYSEKTYTVTVPYVNGEIETTYELADAFYGGLLSLFNEIGAKYTAEGDKTE